MCPVSYTHLDVYKRQLEVCLSLAFADEVVGMPTSKPNVNIKVIRRLTFIRPIIFPPGVDEVLANPTNVYHMIVLDLSGKI